MIVDRYADSTLAYQAYGRDLDRRPFATCSTSPRPGYGGSTFLLDVRGGRTPVASSRKLVRAPTIGTALSPRRSPSTSACRRGYLRLAAAEPDRWHVLNAERSPAELADQILCFVLEREALSQPT